MILGIVAKVGWIVGDSKIHLSKCLVDISTAGLCHLSTSDLTKACTGVKEESA